MNRHWSVSTHLVTDQKTKIIQLRRSRLSKRRILLRIDRSILLDKRIIQLNVSNDWTLFTLISVNSSRCYAARAKINSPSQSTRDDWTFSKQTNFSFFSSQSNFLADFHQDDKRNINQSLPPRSWSRSRFHPQSRQKHLRAENNNFVRPKRFKRRHTMRAI
jgi:hypothetical protein